MRPARLQRGPFALEAAARELLTDYHWPGNVRELQNIITRACVLNQGEPIRADELRPGCAGGETLQQRDSERALAGWHDARRNGTPADRGHAGDVRRPSRRRRPKHSASAFAR